MRSSRAVFVIVTVLVFVSGFVAGKASAQRESNVEEEVRASLERYRLARNTFNADSFMSHFWKSPQLTVISATSEYLGWDGLRKGIAPLFESRASTTDYADTRVFPINNTLAVVYHHYTLKTAKGTGSNSRSTKIFYRMPDGWKVIAEHSSRVPEFVDRRRPE